MLCWAPTSKGNVVKNKNPIYVEMFCGFLSFYFKRKERSSRDSGSCKWQTPGSPWWQYVTVQSKQGFLCMSSDSELWKFSLFFSLLTVFSLGNQFLVQVLHVAVSHFLCDPIMTFETKLTMALAGCSGSCSAKRWHTFSVSLWDFLATNPKILERVTEQRRQDYYFKLLKNPCFFKKHGSPFYNLFYKKVFLLFLLFLNVITKVSILR